MIDNISQSKSGGFLDVFPILPFCGETPSLTDGVLMCVKGQLWPNAKRVAIQLFHLHEDVAFSLEFICHEDETTVARSCHMKSKLIKKEVDIFEMTPKRGEVFEVILLIASSVIKCSINGHHMFNFPISFKSDVKTICKIFGHCDIARISYQVPKPINITLPKRSLTSPPVRISEKSSSAGIQFPILHHNLEEQPFVQPPPIGFLASYPPQSGGSPPSQNPFGDVSGGIVGKLDFLEGIPEGLMINLYASTTHISKWFKISFRTSHLPGDFAFAVHVDLTKCQVVRNDSIDGVMGELETFIPYFPFTPGQPFNVVFKCLLDRYMMAVNGSHFLEFVHRRMELRDVRCVQVEGDLYVSHLFVSR